MWCQCKARITPTSERTVGGGASGQNNSGKAVRCLANAMLSSSADSTESLAERKWIADNGTSFRMTRSDYLLGYIRLCDASTSRVASQVASLVSTTLFAQSFQSREERRD